MKILTNLFRRKHKDKENEIHVQQPDPMVDNAISFGQGFALTELPVVSLFQDEVPFNFLLDTGSNDSIIDSNVLDRIEHTMSDKKGNVFGMEGVSQEVSRCNILLTYKNQGYPYEYLICDMKDAFSKIKAETGVTLHGIIGSKFFNAYKYVLDFDTLIAYSKKQ